jgi:hypothetical protein
VVRKPGAGKEAYRLALLQAEEASRLDPKDASFLTALGAAQYRADQYKEAVATLVQAEPTPAALAVLAMARYRLVERKQAAADLVRLRELLQQPRWRENEEAHALLREAESLVRADSGSHK